MITINKIDFISIEEIKSNPDKYKEIYLRDKIIVFKNLKPTTKGEQGENIKPLDEYTFNSFEYPKSIFFKKIDPNDEENNLFINPNISNENQNQNQNQNKPKDSEIENLQEQIKQLENKQKELESKLENHYHILPTSGMKSFEQAHPYYNKKLD